jgi:uncharacterized protein (TIGR02391 family)
MSLRGRRGFRWRHNYAPTHQVTHEHYGRKVVREFYGINSSGRDEMLFEPGADIYPGDLIDGSRIVSGVERFRKDLKVTFFYSYRELSVADLHPEVRRTAGRLYVDGHYDEAISAATKALEVAVRERSGLPAGGNLMGRALGKDGRLDVRRHGGRTGESEQEGFCLLFMGTSQALRNPRHHEFIADDYASAFEHLSLISLLMRRLDHARPMAGSGPVLEPKPDATPRPADKLA